MSESLISPVPNQHFSHRAQERPAPIDWLMLHKLQGSLDAWLLLTLGRVSSLSGYPIPDSRSSRRTDSA